MKEDNLYPYVAPGLRGRPAYETCVSDPAYAARLAYDDYVVWRTPDLENSGCFPGYQ